MHEWNKQFEGLLAAVTVQQPKEQKYQLKIRLMIKKCVLILHLEGKKEMPL